MVCCREVDLNLCALSKAVYKAWKADQPLQLLANDSSHLHGYTRHDRPLFFEAFVLEIVAHKCSEFRKDIVENRHVPNSFQVFHEEIKKPSSPPLSVMCKYNVDIASIILDRVENHPWVVAALSRPHFIAERFHNLQHTAKYFTEFYSHHSMRERITFNQREKSNVRGPLSCRWPKILR